MELLNHRLIHSKIFALASDSAQSKESNHPEVKHHY